MTKNTNCLEGIRCPTPECGQADSFWIRASATFRFYDDGTDEYHSVEYDDDAFAQCPACKTTGTVASFRVPDANGTG